MIEKPKLQGDLEPLVDFDSAVELARSEGADIWARVLKGLTYVEGAFGGMIFSGSMLESCRFIECDFRKSIFADVVFNKVDFSGCNFYETSFTRCRFEDCKGVGIRLGQCGMKHVGIYNSNMEFADLDRSVLKNVEIVDGTFAGASITLCKLGSVEFRGTKLTKANFFGTPLAKINLTTAEIDGIMVSDTLIELKGAIVNAQQAFGLSKLMGIVIK